MPLVQKKQLADATKLNKFKIIDATKILMKVTKLDELNAYYDELESLKGVEFTNAALRLFNISKVIPEKDLLQIPLTGPFVVISNHPFGLLDGILLVNIISRVRPDFKILANYLLKDIKGLHDNFLYVNPMESKTNDGKNISGLKSAIQHIKNGHPVGIFPAGEVSTYQQDKKMVTDKEWNDGIIKFIAHCQVPIIPVHFKGRNSIGFHVMGMLHPILRTIKIPSELLKKKNKTIDIRIGRSIKVKDIINYQGNIQRLKKYLHSKVYSLHHEIKEKPVTYSTRQSSHLAADIVPPVQEKILYKEIKKITKTGASIHKQKHFELFFADAGEIPNILKELGRLREICFRGVGEGTNKEIDTDEFDKYYQHLFIWDHHTNMLVGAYRIAMGKNIMEIFGKKGFYISTLFKLKKQLNPILEKSIELGRSCVSPTYQKSRYPLFLLWKGLNIIIQRNQAYKYLIGPISISNQYSTLSKSLLIAFIKQHYYDHRLAQYVKPRKKFKVKLGEVDAQVLLDKYNSNIQELEKHIEEIEPNGYKLPVLLKKYFKQNARIFSFQEDPAFNHSLDGLMICEINKIPLETSGILLKK